MRALAVAAALAAGAFASAASAQAGSRQSREFVAAAAGSDTFEMMEAYSALAYSHDPQVLAFARQMIRDHEATSRALADAAAKSGLEPPVPAIAESQSPFLAALQSAQGPEFDKVYWRQQALAHRAALVTQQRYAADGDAPALRQAAQKAIPLIQGHLDMAERMSAAAGGS